MIEISPRCFDIFLLIMSGIAAIVFVVLYFLKAGYGIFRSNRWGVAIDNKIAWVLMEAPVFIVMTMLWWNSERQFETVPLVIFIFFQLHYFQRSFIFPFLMKGKSRMPVTVMLMGVVFNILNGFIQGEWLFYLAPDNRYTVSWLTTPQFIIGTLVFFTGMAINLHSDNVIRHLRKPGDTRHYLPDKGLYSRVTSANYFGEIVEWTGFAILTWSTAGVVFAWWTFANLVPRADAIYHRYRDEFGEQRMGRRKRIFPYIY